MIIINNIIIILSLIVSIISGNYILSIALIPLLFISFFIRKYNKNLEFVYLIFLFFAYVLGYSYDLYHKVYYFDAIVHSMFGVVVSIFALPFLKILKKYNFKEKLFNIIFMIIISLSTSALWEIVEFTIDKIFTSNMQRSLNDTMKDIISAFLFSIVYSLIYLYNTDKINKIFITKK